jgi:hypothetical protein
MEKKNLNLNKNNNREFEFNREKIPSSYSLCFVDALLLSVFVFMCIRERERGKEVKG